MSDAFVVRKGVGSTEIKNGKIIETYANSSPIDPNNFVYFTEGKRREQVLNLDKPGSISKSTTFDSEIVPIDAYRWLFLYVPETGVETTNFVFGMVLKRNEDGSISKGIPIQLTTVYDAYKYEVHVKPLDIVGKFLIAASRSNDNKIRVMQIDDMLITLGEEVTLEQVENDSTSLGYVFNGGTFVEKIDTNIFFLYFNSNGSGGLTYAAVAILAITDLTITIGTKSRLTNLSLYNSSTRILVKLSEGTYLMYYGASSFLPAVIIFHVDSTTITPLMNAVYVTRSGTRATYLMSAIPVDSNRVIFTYADNTNSYLFAVLGTIDPITHDITFGVHIQLTSKTFASFNDNFERAPLVERIDENTWALITNFYWHTETRSISAVYIVKFLEPSFFVTWKEEPFLAPINLLHVPKRVKYKYNTKPNPSTYYPNKVSGILTIGNNNTFGLIGVMRVDIIPDPIAYPSTYRAINLYYILVIKFDTTNKSVDFSIQFLNIPIGGSALPSLDAYVCTLPDTNNNIQVAMYKTAEYINTGTSTEKNAYCSVLTSEQLLLPEIENSNLSTFVDGVAKDLVTKEIKGRIYIN